MPELDTAPADVFKTFVNKLGHICDSAKGGDKVTAFAILQLGTIRYYFTSNRRDEEDYQRTSHYITDILNTLGRVRDDEIRSANGRDERLPVFPLLLRMIIGFNQSRIKGYVCRLGEKLDACIHSAREDRSDGQATLQILEGLKPLLNFSEDTSSFNQFVDGSQRVMQTINLIHRPSFREYLRRRTQNNMERNAPWVVVSHSIGRLLSYYYAVNILISARRNWPQLFVDFEVHWAPSTASRAPSIPRSRLNAAMILGKMSGDQDTISQYRSYAASLEQLGIPLNRKIAEAARPDNLLPFVHAEVNLLDYILRLQKVARTQGNEIPTFFLNDKYIGCSKPTCRLCELYFAHHPSAVAVRPGHRNLYIDWRAPDVYAPDGEDAVRERRLILERMIPLIRDEIFLNLRERFATHSPNDSHDTPSNVPPMDLASETHGFDDLVSQIGQVDISDVSDTRDEWVVEGGSSTEEPSSEAAPRHDVTNGPMGGEDGDIDDEDEGGARL